MEQKEQLAIKVTKIAQTYKSFTELHTKLIHKKIEPYYRYGTAEPQISYTQDDGATSGFIAGGLFNYYWTDSDDKFHFYTGTSLGYASHDAPYLDSRFFYEVHAGARYWISKSFGLNAELGYGFALVKGGISIGL